MDIHLEYQFKKHVRSVVTAQSHPEEPRLPSVKDTEAKCNPCCGWHHVEKITQPPYSDASEAMSISFGVDSHYPKPPNGTCLV